MVKTTLLLLLCFPLAWIGWDELPELLRAQSLRAPEPPAGDAADKVALKTTEAIPEEFEPVKTLVICLGDPKDAPASPRVKTLVAYGQARKKSGDPVAKEQTREEIRRNAILARMTALCPEGKPRLDRLQELDELDRRIEEYREAPLRDEGLCRSARLLVDWIKLERAHPEPLLEELYQQLDRWTLSAPPPESVEPGKHPHSRAYRDFLEKPEAQGPNVPDDANRWVSEARRRASQWEFGLRLLRQLPRTPANAPVPWQQRAAQIRAVVEEVAQAEALAPERLPSARGIIRKLCEALVPPERLDEKVIFFQDKGMHARSEIKVTRTGEEQTRTLAELEASGLDEFSLTARQVKEITVGSETFGPPSDEEPPLKPTLYSVAVHAFNLRRSDVKEWSQGELKGLLDVCQVPENRAALELGGGASSGGKDLIPRLKELLQIVEGHPSLFTSTP
jgi:hypothetical protein